MMVVETMVSLGGSDDRGGSTEADYENMPFQNEDGEKTRKQIFVTATDEGFRQWENFDRGGRKKLVAGHEWTLIVVLRWD